ncbi:retrovirus-related pol polyprotein from transposon TNT 1-94 [Tanacetum coccineum]
MLIDIRLPLRGGFTRKTNHLTYLCNVTSGSPSGTKIVDAQHIIGVKSYLHKYVEQPGPKVVFVDDSTCTTKGYGYIKCNGIVFTKVAFVNGLTYNLISISQLYDAKYIVHFDEKRGIIFNSNKKFVMIAPRVRDVYVLDITSLAQESCFFAKVSECLNWLWHKRLSYLNFKTINQLSKHNLVIGLPSFIYSKDKPCSSCEKGKHHRANLKTKQTSSIKKFLHLLHMDLFGSVTPRSINHENYTLNIVDEYSRVENQNDIKVKQLRTDNVYIHNHKDHLGQFDEKANDGYFLGHLLVSKAFRVFNTRRQKTKETFHITFDESTKAIKFSKPLVDNITIAEPERNKGDETGIVIKNKTRLVAQGYRQEEGIDYDETFAPFLRLEAIRIFLTFATYMNFTVYHMDLKSAFLNGKLKEEVYVQQPPDFESSEFPNHVCKLDKAFYELKQAPRAWCLKGTPSLGLWYLKYSSFDLKGYSDSNYVGYNMDRKSTSAKAEYVAIARCCANILWMKSHLIDYDIVYEKVHLKIARA